MTVYYKQVSADNQVKVGAGRITGIFISNAASTPSLAVYDTENGNTSDAKIIDTFTPVSGTMYNFGEHVAFKNGLYLDITNTVSATVFYE